MTEKIQEEKWYCVVVMTETEMDEEKYGAILDELNDHTDNLAMTCNLFRSEMEPSVLEQIDAKTKNAFQGEPLYLINQVINEEIDQEIEKLENRHKWKKLINLIPQEAYQAAYDRVMLNWDHLVFHSNTLEETIEFLTSK